MDDEEDEVFRPVSRCWGAPFREIKYEDRGTQTPSPALRLRDGMLPCGVFEEPRRLFYGNAGFRLHFPALFEHVGERERNWTRERQQEQRPEQPGLSSEVRIGRNLQLIGDQFHQERVQLYHRTQRNQQPTWWRAVMTVCSLLFGRGGVADRGRGVLR
ncbi:bcl-2-modifying factor-like [Anguilla rostrata]|uniref:bcl-2-modifying factor-like n=1 Tax=Anguilla rostrata TaxID=7938 RepID=UPI0030D4F73C